MRANAWVIGGIVAVTACAEPAVTPLPPRPAVRTDATSTPHEPFPQDAAPKSSVPVLPTQAVPADAAAREDAVRGESLFVGRPAPEFRGQDANGGAHELASHRGRFVVLRFFDAADLPDCVCDANAESDSLWRMQEIDADVIVVGPLVPAKAAQLAHKYGLSFTLLCDADRRIAELYEVGQAGGAVGPNATRQTFVIGPDGTIEAHWPLIVPHGHAARVKAWLDARRAR